MTKDTVLVEIRNAVGEIRICEFDRRTLAAGLRIGASATCEVRLEGPDVAELHGLLEPRSNHWVWHLAKAGVLPATYTRRVDYGTIEVGGYAIRVLPPAEELE